MKKRGRNEERQDGRDGREKRKVSVNVCSFSSIPREEGMKNGRTEGRAGGREEKEGVSTVNI